MTPKHIRQAIININTKLAYKGGLFCVLGSFIIIRSSATHWKMRSLNARMRRIVRGMTGYFSAAQGAGMTLLY